MLRQYLKQFFASPLVSRSRKPQGKRRLFSKMMSERMMAMFLLGVLAFTSSVDASACGALEVMVNGTLLCPPHSSATTTCCWTIMAPLNRRICLKFTTFQVQATRNPEQEEACGSQVFTTYNGYLGPSAQLLNTLCGSSLPAGEICYAAKVISVCYSSNQSDDSDSNPCAITYRIARM